MKREEFDETYIGDGVYASLETGNRIQIILRTARPIDYRTPSHWIALEPEVFTELLRFAYEIGWGKHIAEVFTQRIFERGTREITDEEYARNEEDKQRKRDAAEGFDEN